MKVFLSGKMDEYGAWRDAIIGTVYDHDQRRQLPRWEIVRGMRSYDRTGYRSFNASDDAPPPWPTDENRYVLDLHDYVGPYRVTWDASLGDEDSSTLGYFHGTTWSGAHGQMSAVDQAAIVRECVKGIGRADLVFAYLNRPDCFGTLAEIGLAHALGKYVYLVVDDEAQWDWSDYWFVEELASVRGHAWSVWRGEQPESEAERVRGFFRDALVQWTARPQQPAPLAMVPTRSAASPLDEVAASFSQIARWTADPRVRSEAERMLRRMGR